MMYTQYKVYLLFTLHKSTTDFNETGFVFGRYKYEKRVVCLVLRQSIKVGVDFSSPQSSRVGDQLANVSHVDSSCLDWRGCCMAGAPIGSMYLFKSRLWI